MTADEIKALVQRLRERAEDSAETRSFDASYDDAADALEFLSDQLIAKTELANLYAASLRKAEKEVEGLKVDALKLQRSGQMINSILHDNTVAMQAAWIEWKYGEGAESAMEWIENTLSGPDLIPEEGEPHATDPQAYFDANKSTRMYAESLDAAIAALSQTKEQT